MLTEQIQLQIVAVDQFSHEYLMPSITLPVLDSLREKLVRDRASSHLKWTGYKYGYLLKSNHGYYFVYLQFDEEKRVDRWFTEYEAGSDVFGENGILTGSAHGFQSFEEAQEYCEKDAENLGND
jgi:hypothetical protein